MKKAAWLAVIVALVVFAAGPLYASSVQGTYACRVTSFSSEVALDVSVIQLILLPGDSRGGVQGIKHLVSDRFICSRPAGAFLPCDCAYTVDPTSFYQPLEDRSYTATIKWDASWHNDFVCPPSFTDDWNFVASFGLTGALLQVASDHNGAAIQAGFGTCSMGGQ